MAEPVVIDASALLAVLLDEKGGRATEARLPGSAMSVVNLAEVLSQLDRRGVDSLALRTVVRQLDIELVPADELHAYRAAHIHAATRSHGLSLGDCFCLALAQERNVEALTADRTWAKLRVGVSITLVARES